MIATLVDINKDNKKETVLHIHNEDYSYSKFIQSDGSEIEPSGYIFLMTTPILSF